MYCSLTDVPVYIYPSCIEVSVYLLSLGCSHSKYRCFSHFCLSHSIFFSIISFFVCVSKHLFLCWFVSLYLILAIVLSL